MTKFANKTFTVPMNSKDYENNFDRIFRKRKNEEENDIGDRERTADKEDKKTGCSLPPSEQD